MATVCKCSRAMVTFFCSTVFSLRQTPCLRDRSLQKPSCSAQLKGQGRPSLTPVRFWLGQVDPLLFFLSYSLGAGGSPREATRINRLKKYGNFGNKWLADVCGTSYFFCSQKNSADIMLSSVWRCERFYWS